MNQYKTCCKCKQNLEVLNFGIDKSKKDGLNSRCKKCLSDIYKIQRNKNRNKFLAKEKAYREANKELTKQRQYDWRNRNREKLNETAKKWREENKQKVKDSRKRHYLKLSDQDIRSRRQKYLEKNPYYYINQNAQRRARIKQNEYKVTSSDIKRLKRGRCLYCHAKDNIVLDHIVPLSRGGSHSIGNLVSACQKCNASKYNKFITEWKYYA